MADWTDKDGQGWYECHCRECNEEWHFKTEKEMNDFWSKHLEEEHK